MNWDRLLACRLDKKREQGEWRESRRDGRIKERKKGVSGDFRTIDVGVETGGLFSHSIVTCVFAHKSTP